MHLGVEIRIVSLLVDDESIHATLSKFSVFVRFHGIDLYGYGIEEFAKAAHNLLEVAQADLFEVFPGDEKDVAEPFIVKMPGFLYSLLDGKGFPFDRVGRVEAAVDARITAAVRQIHRRVQSDYAPEPLFGDELSSLGDLFN